MNVVSKKRSLLVLMVVVSIIIGFGSFIGASENKSPEIKNVIMMIPDGTSISHITLARWYNGGKALSMDEIITGVTRTYWKNGPITDSAAAATAFSTGYKTISGYVSVVPSESTLKDSGIKEYNVPKATLIEAAKEVGKSTGIVCTSNLNDATPAGYSSHVVSRKMHNFITEQQVYSKIDVLLGGGSAWLVSGDDTYNRKDGRILKDEIICNGYEYVENREQMINSTSNKLWGAFAKVDMGWDFFNDKDKIPTISDMTKKAIEVLSNNKKGFFLMVEGSKIDWASHYSDAVGVISEVLAFDEAVEVALDYAKGRDDTVVIISADHGNGGLSIGSIKTDSSYETENLESFLEPLRKVKVPDKERVGMLNKDMTNVKEVMQQCCGIEDLTKEEEDYIKYADHDKTRIAINKVVSNRAGIGWTTFGHTGEDVLLYCYHPHNKALCGVVENTDINKYIENILDLNLEMVTKKLFIEAETTFKEVGATVEWDRSSETNPILVVSKGKTILKLPVNKNIAYKNGKQLELDGINVFTGEYLFVSEKTINLLK